MKNAHRHFTKLQKKRAIRNHNNFVARKPSQHLSGRERLLTYIATINFTPKFDLKLVVK